MLKNCTRAARVSWFAEKYSAKIQFTSVKVDKVFEQSGFQMTVEKPKPKQLLRSITAGANSAMNQSQFLAITCNSLKAREK